MHACTTILFDLDGTLSDPSVGFMRSITYALEKMAVPIPPEATLRRWIGPPLRQSLAEFLPPEKIDTALGHYRERYDAGGGMFENSLFPEIPALLAELVAHRKKLLIATAKPHNIARQVIAHFGLTELFHAIYGPEMDGTRNNKAELITHLCALEKLDPAEAVMIGDREHDIIAAHKNQMMGIGVLWGFGDAAELRQAGAAHIVATPNELRALLLA
jgi:phosphoglycolate phosphatase